MNQRELFFVSITIFLTIFAWILLDLYKVQVASDNGLTTTPAVNIKLNSKVFSVLKDKTP